MKDEPIKISEMMYAGAILLMTLLYYWSAQLGFAFSWNHTNVSAVCLPAALSFLVIYYMGYRMWPAIWLGAFLVNAGYFLTNPSLNLLQNICFSFPIATANTLEAVLICFFLKKFIGGNNPLHKVQDILTFMVIGIVACAATAIIGSLTLCLSNPLFWNSYVIIWLTWWMGDLSSLLTLVPAVWALGQKPFTQKNTRLIVEFIISLCILVIVNSLIFDGKTAISQMHVPVTYVPMAVVVWLTYRFGYWGAIISILVTLYQAVVGTTQGFGPFIIGDQNSSLLLLQTYIETVCGTTLLLAATLYERRQMVQAINYSEQRFRALVENSLDMIALLNPLGVITYTSQSAEKIMGFKKSEHEGHNIFEFIHPDDEAYIMGEFSRLLMPNTDKVSAIMRVRHKNGSWRWIESYGQNLLNDPVIGAIVVNYRDITERKRAQQRFHQAVESAPNAMIMVDDQGSIHLVNKATETLFGYSRQELLQMKIETLVPKVFSGKEIEKNLYGIKKEGKEVPVEIGLNPIDEEGKKFVLASIVDMTERRLVEDVLKRDKKALERLIEERSKELLQVQGELKQAGRLADIGTLAAIVAHELRTPLGVIQMAAHNLRNKHKELAFNHHLDNIEKKVWEGNNIIDNLLSYSRIKAPAYETCRILTLVEECFSNHNNLYHDFNVNLVKDYQINADFQVEVDVHQIREVLVNVINNAYQALVNKTGTIEVTLQEKDAKYLQIIIKDSGVGIEQVDLDKVFLPFFTTKAKGTGLGLAICNEIIQYHQGSISMQSTKGQGTTVSIILPFSKQPSLQE